VIGLKELLFRIGTGTGVVATAFRIAPAEQAKEAVEHLVIWCPSLAHRGPGRGTPLISGLNRTFIKLSTAGTKKQHVVGQGHSRLAAGLRYLIYYQNTYRLASKLQLELGDWVIRRTKIRAERLSLLRSITGGGRTKIRVRKS
jgi:hypothetical protein